MSVRIDGPAELTAREVADVFAVRVETVLRWVRAGKLHGVQTPGGKEYRFAREEVATLLEAGRTEGVRRP